MKYEALIHWTIELPDDLYDISDASQHAYDAAQTFDLDLERFGRDQSARVVENSVRRLVEGESFPEKLEPEFLRALVRRNTSYRGPL